MAHHGKDDDERYIRDDFDIRMQDCMNIRLLTISDTFLIKKNLLRQKIKKINTNTIDLA